MMQVSAIPGMRLAACLALSVSVTACGPRERERPPDTGDMPSTAGTSRPTIVDDRPAANRNLPRIVVLGDSLTAGLGLAPEDAYPAVLQRRLDDQGLSYQVVNAGISGDTSAGGLSRLDLALEGDVR